MIRTGRVDALEDPAEEDRKREDGAVEDEGTLLGVEGECRSDVVHRRQHRIAVGKVDHHRLSVL